MSSTNNNDRPSSGGSGNGGGGNDRRQPQNRQPNQQHHSNRIYTRYNDNRPQYRNNKPNNTNTNTSQRPPNQSADALMNRQRSRMVSSSIGDASKMCICCWHELKTYVYYSCAHYVCLNCSVKMRVLCEKIDCPVCRQESRRVLCTKQVLDTSSSGESGGNNATVSPQMIEKLIDKIGQAGCLGSEATAGIYFDCEQIRDECEDLLAYRCSLCPSETETAGRRERFNSMDELEKHMRKAHHRFYCELCIENLKLFAHERKFYDREGLAQHKRVGDRDDFSFKGHPLCKLTNNIS